MDAPFHAQSPIARLIPSTRSIALLTLGIGIGVVAALPLGGGTAIAAVLAILAASGAVAVVVLRPGNPGAVVAADVLLGVAVVATVFGRLGMLYVPMMLAFLAVTARIERTPERSEESLHWEPAPEFEGTMPASVAAPAVIEDEAPDRAPIVTEDEVTVAIEVAPPPFDEPVVIPEIPTVAWGTPPADDEPVAVDDETAARQPHAGKHRAPTPSPVRRVAAVAARTSRRIGAQARAGASNIKAAIVAVPAGEPVLEPEPAPEPADDATPAAPPPLVPVPSNDLDELRHEFEERELEMVAAGKPWSSLTHRAYGELRFLPAPPPPPQPPRRREHVVEIDDTGWETPSWKTLNDP